MATYFLYSDIHSPEKQVKTISTNVSHIQVMYFPQYVLDMFVFFFGITLTLPETTIVICATKKTVKIFGEILFIIEKITNTISKILPE